MNSVEDSELGIPSLRGPVRPGAAEMLGDEAAVRNLALIYALGIDRRDAAMVLSVFASDAVIHGTLGDGVASEYVPRLIEGVRPYEATMHNITNQYVILHDGVGEVWNYAVAVHLEHPESGLMDMAMGVQYRDHVTRASEGWLISERTTVKLWTRGPFPRQMVNDSNPK